MRNKTADQEYLDFSMKSTLKVVQEYRAKYEEIGRILEANPKILDIAHGDFNRVLSQSEYGRGGYTSEQILRSIVVMFIEEKSYRDTVILVENSEFLRNFIKLGNKVMMDFTFLCKAFTALSEETWKAINEALSRYAKKEEKITTEKLRMDTTAYETNIHYPTDSSLLWDSYRTSARLMKDAGDEMRQVGLTHRFHTKKVRKLALYISRNGGKKEKGVQQKIKSTYRKLIERVKWIVSVGEVAEKLLSRGNLKAMTVAAELKHYLPIEKKIISQAERRVIMGEQVPSTEKVYSLFEEHTELIKRGKAGKPIEFGHKVLLAETGEKFIIHYETMPKQKADTELIKESLNMHTIRYLEAALPVLAGDKGFYESREQIRNLSKKIETVSICKKGRRTAEEDKRESTEEFKAGQRFRAGIEGTISVLKRAFKLSKCFFKGFKNFASSVGCAVFCHNLVMLART